MLQGNGGTRVEKDVMLISAIVKLVEFCARHPWRVFALGILIAAAAVAFDVTHFSITTDTESLIAGICRGASGRPNSKGRFRKRKFWSS
jgi:hypothetical protein